MLKSLFTQPSAYLLILPAVEEGFHIHTAGASARTTDVDLNDLPLQFVLHRAHTSPIARGLTQGAWSGIEHGASRPRDRRNSGHPQPALCPRGIPYASAPARLPPGQVPRADTQPYFLKPNTYSANDSAAVANIETHIYNWASQPHSDHWPAIAPQHSTRNAPKLLTTPTTTALAGYMPALVSRHGLHTAVIQHSLDIVYQTFNFRTRTATSCLQFQRPQFAGIHKFWRKLQRQHCYRRTDHCQKTQ